MPRKLSGPAWSRTVGIAGAAGAAWALAFGAATADAKKAGLPGGADEACVERVSTPVFQPLFGDPASYFLMPGGDFEGTLDWASTGPVSLVGEEKPFELNAVTDKQALRLERGASVTSPPLCVTSLNPHLRFVALAGGRGRLAIKVRLYSPDGRSISVEKGFLSPAAHRAWAPSVEIDLNTELLDDEDVAYADVRLKSHGDWQVDDMYVDPYAR